MERARERTRESERQMCLSLMAGHGQRVCHSSHYQSLTAPVVCELLSHTFCYLNATWRPRVCRFLLVSISCLLDRPTFKHNVTATLTERVCLSLIT